MKITTSLLALKWTEKKEHVIAIGAKMTGKKKGTFTCKSHLKCPKCSNCSR
jgi:hypothetical protein